MTDLPTVPLDRHADFQMLAPTTHRLPPPPRFHFGDFPAALAALFYGRGRIPPTGVFATSGVTVSAGLILSAGDRLIESPQLNWQGSLIDQAVARHGLPDAAAPVRTPPGPCALIVTPGYPIYGHWLADILPRLGLLEAAGYDLDSLTYIVAADTPPFALELLRLAGIGPERLVTLDEAGPIRPHTLLLPTFPHNGRQFTPLMAQAAGVLRGRIEARFGRLDCGATPASILVSRQGWGARRMADRMAFEATAARHGFTIVSPETLPMLDQLRLFAGAREIVGEYGSGLHASLFSPAGTVVCALRGTLPHPAFLQSGIGDALNQPTGYLFGQASGDPAKYGFGVDPADLSACLDAVFGGRRPPAPATVPPTLAQARPAPRPDPEGARDGDPADRLAALLAALDGGLPHPGALAAAERLGAELLAAAPRLPGLALALVRLHGMLDQPDAAIRFAIGAIDQDPADATARAALAALLPAIAMPDGVADPVALDFSAAGNAAQHLREGWSRQEPRHTWMLGTLSRLVLPRLSAQADWLGLLDASPILPSAPLVVRYGGHEVARMQVARAGGIGFRVPRELAGAAVSSELCFEHPEPRSPHELGRNNDRRALAFAVRSLHLTMPAPPDPQGP